MTALSCSTATCRVSTALLLAATLATAGCSDAAPRQYVYAGKSYAIGKDVACLERETSDFHMAYYRAVTVCGTSIADLTGDGKLQRQAWAWQLPFTINPAADAAIKAKFPYTGTATLIANLAPDRNFIGGPYE